MDFFTKFWAHWEWISSKVLETLEWTFSAVPGTWWAGGIRFLVYCCINTMGTLWMDIFFICFSDIKNGHLQMFCRHWEWTSPNLGDVRNGHLQMFFGTLGMDFIFSCFGTLGMVVFFTCFREIKNGHHQLFWDIGNGHLQLFWEHWEWTSSSPVLGTLRMHFFSCLVRDRHCWSWLWLSCNLSS